MAITRQMKALNVNPKMIGLAAGPDQPKFYEVLGRDAEFVYGATTWLPQLVELRAGGLIQIARQYPGAREFVESYERLITRDKVDAILGPYSSLITEAVADVTEKHRMPMVAPIASATSIFKKGRKFIFMVLPAAEVWLEGSTV